MKKYVMPQGDVKRFAVNDCVAACITGVLQCQYPGNGVSNGKKQFDDYNGKESGWWYEDREHKMPHGVCGYDQTVTFSTTGPRARESNGRSVYNISGYQEQVGTYEDVTWNSFYGSEYHHKGRLTITNVDDKHPNHS